MRRSVAWLVAVPLMLAGSQAAHSLAYALVFPQRSVRLHALAAAGHGYLSWLPLCFGIVGAGALVALAMAAADAARGRHVRDLPPPAFALLPPAAFALQELLELSLHTGAFGWRAVLAPTFAPGLLLQLPFAALAYLAARALLLAAERVGRALARPTPRARAVVRVAAPATTFLCSRFGSASRAARAPPRAVVI